MDSNQFLLVGGILLVGALLVAGGGLLGLRAGRQQNKPADPAQSPDPTATPADPATPKRELPSWLSDWQRRLPPDAFLISRDPASGEWLVEMEGQRYRRLSDIHDNRAATKILSAIEGLRTFAGLVTAEPQSPAAAPLLAPALSTAGTPRRSRQATYPAPEGSIIAQIETILQRELVQQPDLAERSIHMGAKADGSLLIEIDQIYYRSPDEIPDPRVRDVVLMAVRTWEKSN